MAFPYSNSLAGAPASYPGSLFDPVDVRNRLADGVDIVDEAFTVPADPDSEGRYRVNLNQAVLNRAGVNIRVGGQARTPVPYGQTVGATQVGVSLETGVLEFNAGDAGGSGLATYKAAGTAMMAHIINRVQNEVRAVQQEVDAFDVNLGSPGPIGNTTPNTGAFTTLQADSLGISDSGSITGVSTGLMALNSSVLRVDSTTRTEFRRFAAGGTNGVVFDFFRARGTVSSQAPIVANDLAGQLRWSVLDPFDGGIGIQVAEIRAQAVAGQVVAAGRMDFRLNDGSDSGPNFVPMRIDWDLVTVGAVSPADLVVNGDVECDDLFADGELHVNRDIGVNADQVLVNSGNDVGAWLFGQPVGIAWQNATARLTATATPDSTKAANVPFAASRFDVGTLQGLTKNISFFDNDYNEHEVQIVGGLIIGWDVS